MAHGTSEEVATKLIQRLGLATEDIRRGINAVKEAPGLKAAANSDKWIRNLTASVAKYKAKVGKVSLGDWQAAFLAKVDRVASGAAASKAKIIAYYDDALPVIDALSVAIAAMPDMTISDSIARATKQIQGMYDYGQARAKAGK